MDRWEKVVEAYLKYADKDKDGYISKDELAKVQKYISEHHNHVFDQAAFDELFKQSDKNGDGKLTKQELASFLATKAAK